MKRINTRGKITSTPPSILPAAALLISNTNYNTGTHTQTHRRTQTLQIHLHFLSRFFFCEMFDRLHQCKKWSRGERERQNGWDSRKERGSTTREQETEKKRQKAKRGERKRDEESRCSLYPPATSLILAMKDRHRGEITKTEDVHYQSALFLSMHSSLSSHPSSYLSCSLSPSFFPSKPVFQAQSARVNARQWKYTKILQISVRKYTRTQSIK